MTTQGYLFDLGQRDYSDVLALQRKLVELRAKKTIPDSLLLTEHNHVFTIGKSMLGALSNQINGISVIKIERGGEWTYHGPGQLVGYPILDLEARNCNIHEFLRNLEETLIRALAEFEIYAERNTAQTGVWVKEKKIASIGVAIRKWVTFHGFALNVNTDLNYFAMISPCGLPSSTMTSMKTLLHRDIAMDDVKNSVSRMFKAIFQLRLEEKPVEALPASVI